MAERAQFSKARPEYIEYWTKKARSEEDTAPDHKEQTAPIQGPKLNKGGSMADDTINYADVTIDRSTGMPSPAAKERWETLNAGNAHIELPAEALNGEKSAGIDSLSAGELPMFLHGRIKAAHLYNHLPQTLDHYVGALSGLNMLDSSSLQSLKNLRAQVTGNWQHDEQIVPKIIEIIDGLRAQRRK